MTARRPLLTAAAAASMLCALWFVPSAGATPDRAGEGPARPGGSHSVAGPGAPDGPDLADSGSVDITPYLVGGTGFLGLGVAMVTASVRRARTPAY
ncbi:hypothetical protein [Streptomyces sp. NPDC018031]|uniref:hypothetical protein n=1 Tax=Streptomyces sp. NPDC018031 TaxID=3365033 RepID=UPI0037A14324